MNKVKARTATFIRGWSSFANKYQSILDDEKTIYPLVEPCASSYMLFKTLLPEEKKAYSQACDQNMGAFTARRGYLLQ